MTNPYVLERDRPDHGARRRRGVRGSPHPGAGRTPQSGIALITAMLIAGLCTAGIVALAFEQQLETRKVANILAGDLAAIRIAELEVLARRLLVEDLAHNRYDAADEAWATTQLAVAPDTLPATGRLRDLQGLFNLTSLATSPLFVTADAAPTGLDDAPAAPAAIAGQPATGTVESPAPAATPVDELQSTGPPQYGRSVPMPPQPAKVNVYTHGGMERILLEARANRRRRAPAAPAAPASPSPPASVADGDAAAPPPPAAVATDAETSAQSPQAIAEMRLRRLFKTLSIPPEPVQAILDWIDPDTETRFPNGAEDDYYTELKPGYRAANRPLSTRRELLLVKGITPEIYAKLAPFVVCLPKPTPININTAPLEILRSLSPSFDESTARLILRARAAQPFLTLETLATHPGLRGRLTSLSELAVASEYFELSSVIHDAHAALRSTSLMERRGDRVAVVQRWRKGYPEE